MMSFSVYGPTSSSNCGRRAVYASNDTRSVRRKKLSRGQNPNRLHDEGYDHPAQQEATLAALRAFVPTLPLDQEARNARNKAQSLVQQWRQNPTGAWINDPFQKTGHTTIQAARHAATSCVSVLSHKEIRDQINKIIPLLKTKPESDEALTAAKTLIRSLADNKTDFQDNPEIYNTLSEAGLAAKYGVIALKISATRNPDHAMPPKAVPTVGGGASATDAGEAAVHGTVLNLARLFDTQASQDIFEKSTQTVMSILENPKGIDPLALGQIKNAFIDVLKCKRGTGKHTYAAIQSMSELMMAKIKDSSTDPHHRRKLIRLLQTLHTDNKYHQQNKGIFKVRLKGHVLTEENKTQLHQWATPVRKAVVEGRVVDPAYPKGT